MHGRTQFDRNTGTTRLLLTNFFILAQYACKVVLLRAAAVLGGQEQDRLRMIQGQIKYLLSCLPNALEKTNCGAMNTTLREEGHGLLRSKCFANRTCGRTFVPGSSRDLPPTQDQSMAAVSAS